MRREQRATRPPIDLTRFLPPTDFPPKKRPPSKPSTPIENTRNRLSEFTVPLALTLLATMRFQTARGYDVNGQRLPDRRKTGGTWYNLHDVLRARRQEEIDDSSNLDRMATYGPLMSSKPVDKGAEPPQET